MTPTLLEEINWHDVQTVLLDMDGTLLDLSFDTRFWLHTLPAHLAKVHNLDEQEANNLVLSYAQRTQGTLDWYCLDRWTAQVDADIRALKRQHAEGICWLPGALSFLDALSVLPAQKVLATNAHPYILALKQERLQIQRYFDRAVTSHDFAAPKEYPEFWQALERNFGIDLSRTVMIDDSVSVLASAQAAGVAHQIEIMQPDSVFGKHSSGAQKGYSFTEVESVRDIEASLKHALAQ